MHLDVLVLSSGGNLLDSLALALCALLSESLLPKAGPSMATFGVQKVRKTWGDHEGNFTKKENTYKLHHRKKVYGSTFM